MNCRLSNYCTCNSISKQLESVWLNLWSDVSHWVLWMYRRGSDGYKFQDIYLLHVLHLAVWKLSLYSADCREKWETWQLYCSLITSRGLDALMIYFFLHLMQLSSVQLSHCPFIHLSEHCSLTKSDYSCKNVLQFLLVSAHKGMTIQFGIQVKLISYCSPWSICKFLQKNWKS